MNNADRQKRYRDNKRNAPVTETVTRVTPEPDRNARASLEDYQDEHGRKYAHRAHPEELNWGPRMNSQELAEAGSRANRVAIPGDWDYKEGS